MHPAPPVMTAPENAEARTPESTPPTGVQGILFCVSCSAENARGDAYCHACGSQLRKPQPTRGAKKSAPKKQVPGPRFTTTQWIVICVASFVLGGVVTAAFVPSAGGNSEATGEAATGDTQAQDPKRPTLVQVNAARDAAEANPSDMSAQLKYANILHDVMMLDQAIAQYKLYLATIPDNVDARIDLGICYFEQKKFAEAIVEMETAVKADPQHQLGNYNLGIVNLNAGNEEKAREWFTKARDIDPSTPYGQNADRILKEAAGDKAQ